MTRAGGRRRADEPEPVEPRRSAVLPVVLLVLAVVAGVALWLGGGAEPVDQARGGESLVEPDQQQVVCPPTQGAAATTRVGLPAGAAGSGEVSAGGEPVDVPPGGVVDRDAEAGQPDVLTATGAATRGLFATRELSAGALAGCVAPRASWWYAGAGASPSHSSVLRLANPATGPAVLDVDVWGPDGEVPGPQLRGIALRPGESTSLRLADVAPSPGSLAVHVDASQGLVASSLVDAVTPLTAKGGSEEDDPATRAPSRRLVVNGLAAPRGGVLTGRQLPAGLAEGASVVLGNPGDRAVTARLRLSGKDGLSQPPGPTQTTVPPQSTVTVPLGSAVGDAAQALVVDADGPLVGGYQSPGGSDLVHGVGASGWEGPAAAALPGSGDARVELTARSRSASVTVSSYDARGRRLERRTVRVGARTTVASAVPGRAASVVVDSDGGVTGAVRVQRADGTSVLPLAPLLEALLVPDVRPG